MLGSAARHWFSVLPFSSNSSPVSKTFQHWHLLNGTSHLFPWQLPNISPFAHYSGVPRPSRWENAIWECQQLWKCMAYIMGLSENRVRPRGVACPNGIAGHWMNPRQTFYFVEKALSILNCWRLTGRVVKNALLQTGFSSGLHSSHWLQVPFLPSYVHISIICEGVGNFIPSVNPNRNSMHL